MHVPRLIFAWIPAPCLFCGATGDHDGVCGGCRADLPGWGAPRCPVCAIATPLGDRCGQCMQAAPAYSATVAAASYAFPLDAAVVRFKYGRDLALAGGLGALLCEAVGAQPAPQLVVPMPLSDARLRTRGFNQAAELARVVASRLRLPLDCGAARRTRDAAPQASLPLAERGANVRGAFESTRALPGMHVAVVDDVMTTGATLDALARALRRAGAQRVVCWVLARTERHD